MSRERKTTTPEAAPDASQAAANPESNLPYGYAPADRSVGSQSHPPPPRQYYHRQDTPRPDPLRRHLPAPTRPRTIRSAATNVNPTPAAAQAPPPRPPPPQQQQERIVFQSRVPMRHYDAGNYLAHILLMAEPNVRTMFPVEEAPVRQEMFKQDVEGAKILKNMSAKDWEEYRKNGGS